MAMGWLYLLWPFPWLRASYTPDKELDTDNNILEMGRKVRNSKNRTQTSRVRFGFES